MNYTWSLKSSIPLTIILQDYGDRAFYVLTPPSYSSSSLSLLSFFRSNYIGEHLCTFDSGKSFNHSLLKNLVVHLNTQTVQMQSVSFQCGGVCLLPFPLELIPVEIIFDVYNV